MYDNREGWCQGLDLHNSSNHIKLHIITAKFSEVKGLKHSRFLQTAKVNLKHTTNFSLAFSYIQTRVSSFVPV